MLRLQLRYAESEVSDNKCVVRDAEGETDGAKSQTKVAEVR